MVLLSGRQKQLDLTDVRRDVAGKELSELGSCSATVTLRLVFNFEDFDLTEFRGYGDETVSVIYVFGVDMQHIRIELALAIGEKLGHGVFHHHFQSAFVYIDLVNVELCVVATHYQVVLAVELKVSHFVRRVIDAILDLIALVPINIDVQMENVWLLRFLDLFLFRMLSNHPNVISLAIASHVETFA